MLFSESLSLQDLFAFLFYVHWRIFTHIERSPASEDLDLMHGAQGHSWHGTLFFKVSSEKPVTHTFKYPCLIKQQSLFLCFISMTWAKYERDSNP